jgi:AcrR family transcriptional regulator
MSGKKRTRLSPEARRDQLLDSARDLIQNQGFSGFTMEALASEAGLQVL